MLCKHEIQQLNYESDESSRTYARLHNNVFYTFSVAFHNIFVAVYKNNYDLQEFEANLIEHFNFLVGDPL